MAANVGPQGSLYYKILNIEFRIFPKSRFLKRVGVDSKFFSGQVASSLPKWGIWNVLEEGRLLSVRQDTFWKSSHTVGRDAWARCGAVGMSWEGRPGLCSLRLVLSSTRYWG